MKKLKFLVVLSLVALFATPALAADTIKIGFNIPMTGDIPEVGEGSKNAAEMYLADINGAGGLEVGQGLQHGSHRGAVRGGAFDGPASRGAVAAQLGSVAPDDDRGGRLHGLPHADRNHDEPDGAGAR